MMGRWSIEAFCPIDSLKYSDSSMTCTGLKKEVGMNLKCMAFCKKVCD